jgi:hypothetical protein
MTGVDLFLAMVAGQLTGGRARRAVGQVEVPKAGRGVAI